jgi:hypothetical protein
MSGPVMLADLLQASRLIALRDAVVTTLDSAFPDVQVKSHPGKLDMADVLKEGTFTAPSIHVALARLKNEERCSGSQDLPVHFRAYVVAESRPVDGAVYQGDEIGYALLLGLLDALELPDIARWGLPDIGLPEGAEGEPLFTLKTFERGTVYYVVTWRQTLYAEGQQLENLGGPWTSGTWGTP